MNYRNSGPAQYLDYLKMAPTIEDEEIISRGIELLERFSISKNIDSNYSPLIYLLDFRSQKYLIMGKSCVRMLGYPVKNFIEGGLEFYLSKHKKDEFDLYNSKMFPEMIRFLENIPQERRKSLVFSRNHQLKTIDGNYLNILQRSSFIYNSEGIPTAAVGIGIDITHFKSDTNITHTIEEIDTSTGNPRAQLLYKKFYFIENCNRFLTAKEIEVLKWICSGLSSKQIAAKMKISINTVNNHRKNMLMKSNCQNIFELVAYSVKNGFI